MNRHSPSISASSDIARVITAAIGFILSSGVSEASRTEVHSAIARRFPLPNGTERKSPGAACIPSGMR